MKLKVKGKDLPSQGRYYFSEQPIAELFLIIDEVVDYKQARCDCDSFNRCCECRMRTKTAYLRESLKKKISEVFE